MNWQPMSTAPRDGRWVLLWWKHAKHFPDSTAATLARWDGKFWADQEGTIAAESDFTHWCPIVAPSISEVDIEL